MERHLMKMESAAGGQEKEKEKPQHEMFLEESD